MLTALLAALTTASAGTVLVDFLDIGQGDSIVIRGGGKTVLIDAGDRGSDTVRQLKQLQVERLDLVVATHPHADHIGRMQDVLQTFEVGLYIDNGMTHTTATYEAVMTALEANGANYATAVAGRRINMGDEAILTVLNPGETLLTGTRSDLNSNSVVVRLDHDDMSFLFTGDAEEPTEYRLMSRGMKPVTVLKVAHHGSSHSTSPSFVTATAAKYAVISVGADNRYKHPSDATIGRLTDNGAVVYRTDLSGNVRVYSDGKSVEFLEGALRDLGDGASLLTTPPVVDTAPPPPDKPEAPLSEPEPEVDQAAIDRAARKAAKAETKRRKQAEKKRRKSDWPIENQPPPKGRKLPTPLRVGGASWS